MTTFIRPTNSVIAPLPPEEWAHILPQTVFAALADDPTLFWLDAGTSPDRWSYLGIAPVQSIPPHTVLSQLAAGAIELHDSNNFRHRPPFDGRLVQLNYPAARTPFSVSSQAETCMRGHQYQNVLAYSHAGKSWLSIGCSKLSSPQTTCDFAVRLLDRCRCINIKQEESKYQALTPDKTQSNDLHYLWAIQCALNYIEAGDIYQINISKKFSAPWRETPAQLYIRMRAKSPPAYGAYLGPALTVDGHAICCISPELFLRVKGNNVLTRPIKGTRPLGLNAAETTAARRELETNSKERAELNMIVDLERNDLGRICEYGSVCVESSGEVEQLPTLLHRTAAVSGRLRPDATVGELLEATFPGGSITGAPKIRAMQLIAQLELEPRGAYCGAIGWIGQQGGMELNIAIRTAVVDSANGLAHYYAGSGIVADSDPIKESEETLLKAAPFFQAIAE